MIIKTDNTQVALNSIRRYLNGKHKPECVQEWISWLISLLGENHAISKQLEPLLHKQYEQDKLHQMVYNIIVDNT